MKYDETEIRVRFNEVDSWGMVWHGHYIAWFEVGRMALLGKYQLLPQDFSRMGYLAPVYLITGRVSMALPFLCYPHFKQ